MSIADTAIIHEGVNIGENVIIRDYVIIYPGVTIEDNVEIMEGSVIGRLPKGVQSLSRKPEERYKKVKIGYGSVISNNTIIYTDVFIGQSTLIGDGVSIRENCKIGNNCVIGRYVAINYSTSIGDYTKIMSHSNITGNMNIGNNVFISVNVSTSNDNNLGGLGYNEYEINGPTIHDNALIGASANLLPGVVIGKSSIVGASALVTKDVLENTLVMGVPARIVKR